jgi:hypothetical protein
VLLKSFAFGTAFALTCFAPRAFAQVPACSPTPPVSALCKLQRAMALQQALGTMRAGQQLLAASTYLDRVTSFIATDLLQDTLIANAVASSDTAGAVRLVRYRAALDVQLLAMLDKLNKMQIINGTQGVPLDAFRIVGARIHEDHTLTTLVDSVAQSRKP